MFNLDSKMLLIVFGVVFLLAWSLGLFGKWRTWYFRSRRAIYAYLPIGLLFIVAAFEPDIKAAQGPATWPLYAVYGVLIVVAMWWTIRTPSSLIPWWAREIDARAPELYFYLAQSTRKKKDWQENLVDPQTWTRWLDKMEKEARKKIK